MNNTENKNKPSEKADQPNDITKSICTAIILSGTRKGEQCGRKPKTDQNRCGYHRNKSNRLKTKFTILQKPGDMMATRSAQMSVIKSIIPVKLEVVKCSVCLEPLEEDTLTLKCSHQFHLGCMIQIEQNNCPLCRRKILDVPKYVKLFLKKNFDNNRTIKKLEDEIAALRDQLKEYTDLYGDLNQIFCFMFSSVQR